MTCPKCGSSDTRTSKSPRWIDVLQRVLGRKAFRCRTCRKRFFALPSSPLTLKPAEKPSRGHQSRRILTTRARNRLKRTITLAAIFALAFVLFLIFLRFIMADKDHNYSSESVGAHLSTSLF
jgi:hypothetical protein